MFQSDLSEKRTALSFLLVDILNQQQERKKHLLQTLIRMEHNRWVSSIFKTFYLYTFK